MIRRYLPWLFLAAALFGLAAALTAKHVNWLWVGYRVTHVFIAIAYLIPHHRHW